MRIYINWTGMVEPIVGSDSTEGEIQTRQASLSESGPMNRQPWIQPCGELAPLCEHRVVSVNRSYLAPAVIVGGL